MRSDIDPIERVAYFKKKYPLTVSREPTSATGSPLRRMGAHRPREY